MKLLFWLVSGIVTLVLAATIFVGWAAIQVWSTASENSTPVSFVIEQGEHVGEIANNLKEQGLIQSAWLFKTFVRLTNASEKLQAGTYELKPGEGIAELFLNFRYGQNQNAVWITIPEGFNLSQIGQLVEEKLGVSPEDWQEAVGPSSYLIDLFPLLTDKPASVDLEGYLFPDTYQFTIGTNADDVAKTMVINLGNKIADNASQIPDQESWHDLLTLASILEREVQSDKDRAIVADIFKRRLQIGMALQADSTVNYVTGGNSPSISLDDREVDSLYNTYKYPGLPPGPICNPGISAILAAANPEPNDYWYFLTDSEGKVYYAKTYEEHLANKQAYLD